MRPATGAILAGDLRAAKGDAQGDANSRDRKSQDEAEDLATEAVLSKKDLEPGRKPGKSSLQRTTENGLIWRNARNWQE